jgi:hypothetical protein
MRFSCLVMVLAIGCGGGGGSGGDDTPAAVDAAAAADAYAGPSAVRTYQQGVSGYSGTKSIGISTYGGLGSPGQYNANGMTFADGLNDWCTGTDIPSGNYSEIWLLRFEDLGLAPGTHVVGATLSIHGYGNGSGGQFYAGSYLAMPWYGDTPITCAGCSDSPIGWRYRNGPGAAWGALGAGAAGADTIAGKVFRIPEAGFLSTSSAPNEYTTALDPAVVQGWVDRQNYGVRIVAGVTNVHMGYVPAQRDPAGRPIEMRPKLTITIAP